MALLKLQSFLLASISSLSMAPGVPYFDSRVYSSGRPNNFQNAKDIVSTTIRVEANAWDAQNEPPSSLTSIGIAIQGTGREQWPDSAHSPRCNKLLEAAGLGACELQTCWHDQKESRWHFAVDCCASRTALLLLRLIGDCSGSFSSDSITETSSSHFTGRTTGSCVYSGLFRGTCLTRPRRFSSCSTPRNLQFGFSFFSALFCIMPCFHLLQAVRTTFTLFQPRLPALDGPASALQSPASHSFAQLGQRARLVWHA